MNEEELIQETRKLIGRWDNVRIVGQGWAGDPRRGFEFNPIRTIPVGGGTTPVTPTGACCPEDGDCFISTQSICEEGGGTYQGDDTTCDPDPCPPKGACCVGTDCTIETEDDCTGMGGTYQGDDTVCDPNPCTEPTCCTSAYVNPLGDGRCFLSYAYAQHITIYHPGTFCLDTHCDQTATVTKDPITCVETCISSGLTIQSDGPTPPCSFVHADGCSELFGNCVGVYADCHYLPGTSVSGDTLTFEYFCGDGCDSSMNGCEHGIVTWTYSDECVCI